MRSFGESGTKVSGEIVSTNQSSITIQGTYPLCMEICLLSIRTNKVAINSRFVNAIKFPLELEKVRLSERPRLRHRQPVQLVANLHQTFVLFLEPFSNLSFPIRLVSQMSVGPEVRVVRTAPEQSRSTANIAPAIPSTHPDLEAVCHQRQQIDRPSNFPESSPAAFAS